jgi:hypothetical protein
MYKEYSTNGVKGTADRMLVRKAERKRLQERKVGK